MNRLQSLRHSAFIAQGGLCFYCGLPMWESGGIDDFARQHNISAKQAKQNLCTAEHLQAQQDGGRDTASNIAACCRFCNAHRHMHNPKHAPTAEAFREHVRSRIARGKWHPMLAQLQNINKKSPPGYGRALHIASQSVHSDGHIRH